MLKKQHFWNRLTLKNGDNSYFQAVMIFLKSE